MNDNSNEIIIDQLKKKRTKKKAFNRLVQTYQEQLYWHIRKMVIIHDDANDVLQNTFVKAWQAIDNFRGDSKLYTWLYRIATNESLNFLKKKKNQSEYSLTDYETVLADSLESDEYFSGDEMQKKLQKAILKLPEKQRLVFNMKYFDAMKYDEISKILDTSVGALKASYHHAVKKIEQLLTDD